MQLILVSGFAGILIRFIIGVGVEIYEQERILQLVTLVFVHCKEKQVIALLLRKQIDRSSYAFPEIVMVLVVRKEFDYHFPVFPSLAQKPPVGFKFRGLYHYHISFLG